MLLLRFSILAATAIALTATAAPVPAVDGSTDQRLAPPIHLRRHYFRFDPPATAEAWRERAGEVRRRVQVAAGLWPAPPRREPNAVAHGLVVRDGYTVEKVYLESFPGHFVTGSLYRPKGFAGPRPGVLSPYGHWGGGRYFDLGEAGVKDQIERGAEEDPVGGRYPIQARCVQLARMGCVVFNYDMVGYADSQQLTHRQIHAATEESIAAAIGEGGWGFYSTQAESRLQGPLGLQTFNSRCALDWLAGLPEVDSERLAITGGSSGGTQTLMASAVDQRLDVAFPVVMVSTAMQGGCGCENACCLRVGTGNAEIAALFAPKPLGMASANDWTVETISRGYPEIRHVYDLLGASANTRLRSATEFRHNYNLSSRRAMYAWMNEHLDLGAERPTEERPYRPLSDSELCVWDDQHPAPPSGVEHERALLKAWAAITDRQLDALAPTDEASLVEYRRVVGGALETILAVGDLTAADLRITETDQEDRAPPNVRHLTVLRRSTGAALEAVLVEPQDSCRSVVLWAHERGVAGLYQDNGEFVPEVRGLLDRGVAILAADLLGQGAVEEQRALQFNDDKPLASMTFGYNRPLLAHRAADLLTLAVAARRLAPEADRIELTATAGAAPYAAAAWAVAGDRLSALNIDTGGFRFAGLGSWRHAQFLPGAVKYGDLPAMLALGAPRPLRVIGEGGEGLPLVGRAYEAAGAADRLSVAADGPLIDERD
ncbi:hypothetical protein Mal64_14660 [Pseudobythopirellula maris]|uniref:Acetyl xylan esterase (AXE1) n=1 Tax=Pseudobythopirellula maris TaxID=2527991 RepID=A0A5C5ZVM5_9BACT|nr:acetylxylan esterase [Pseudobythopirellula maris]TWT91067.1 hypothetical protein Mal64_14660 [Pseudobythopirellula maris]